VLFQTNVILECFFIGLPKRLENLFSTLVNDGYKGSGDYGVFGIGVYNGQTANRPELNDNKHIVARMAYPFTIKNQIIEPGIQAYTGQFTLPVSQLSRNVKYKKDLTYLDQRQAASLILYPRPFGFMAEYNIGRGPQYNAVTDSIEVRPLKGGYITVNYRAAYKSQYFYPFVRYHYYDGGKKHETDARSYLVRELEFGLEWLPVKNFEIVAMYTFSNRRFEDSVLRNNTQKGSLLRLQAQVNF
jgi:hypothetical protein